MRFALYPRYILKSQVALYVCILCMMLMLCSAGKSARGTPCHSCYAYMFCLVPSVTLLEGDAQTPIENLMEGNSVFDHKHNTRNVSLNHHFDLNNTLTPHNNQTTRNQDARQANGTAGTTATVVVVRTNSPITKRSCWSSRPIREQTTNQTTVSYVYGYFWMIDLHVQLDETSRSFIFPRLESSLGVVCCNLQDEQQEDVADYRKQQQTTKETITFSSRTKRNQLAAVRSMRPPQQQRRGSHYSVAAARTLYPPAVSRPALLPPVRVRVVLQ